MSELKFSKKKQLQKNSIDVQEFKETFLLESHLQSQCDDYLQYFPNVKVIRIPDALFKWIYMPQGKTSSYLQNILKYVQSIVSKYLKGIPDLIILKKYDDIYCKAVCFELKKKDGIMSQGQKNFSKVVPVIIIRSFEQFFKEFNQFINEE